jgi:hypothetical protein
LQGGGGNDTLVGGAGNDTYVINSTTVQVVENAGDGVDTVESSVNYTLGDNLENLTLSGTTLSRGYGNALNNVLTGSSNVANLLDGMLGDDSLQGKAKNDILRGGAGNDLMRELGGNNIFDAGAGDDTLEGKDGNELYIGGTGADVIRTGLGYDVISFNGGDGIDTVIAGAGRDNTVSLGLGIGNANLVLQKSGNDLVLALGVSDQLILRDWYAAEENHSVAKLQMIANSTVQIFDFQKLAGYFDSARQADPALVSWAFAERLGDALLSTHDAKALGGSSAYEYARSGNTQVVDLIGWFGELADPVFGVQVQGMVQTMPMPGATLEG